MKKPLFITLLVVIALGVAVGISRAIPSTYVPIESGDRMMSIEDYVRLTISDLSPKKEQLGGKFYVTDIQAEEGEGTVAYEDGHNAYVADFTYTTDERTGHSIDSFEIRD